MDFNPNLKNSKKKAIKIDYNENNKMPKVSNFFRGDIVTNNNNKQPKRFSYDKKEPYYSSHIKENELEPKLLIEKLPPAFNLKNQRNSNDSKNTANTKYSSNEQKNNGYNKLALNNSNEASPEEIIKINFNKQKKKKEQETKINNYFIEKERNIQKQLQIKKDNNKINNKRISSIKIVTNNDYQKNKIKSKDYYNNNILIYNNSNNTNNNNNSHIKTDFSEYDGIKQKNNLIDLEVNSKYNTKDYITNSTFNKNNNLEIKYKLNTINIKNKNNNNILNNELLNTSDLFRKKKRKSSDPDTYHIELKEQNTDYEKKKNIRSGSYMNMVNYQYILQTDSYYSPVSTNTNINTIANFTGNNFSIGGNTLKETEDFKLSGNQVLKPIFPHKKSSDKMQKLKSIRCINNNIRSIKNLTKIKKMPIISGGVLGGININLKYNNNNSHNNHNNEENEHENENYNKENLNNKEIENINEGITFRYNSGYKYYFNLRSANIYFLKEVQNNIAKVISSSVNTWNKIFINNNNYLTIICRKINTPENYCTFVIEYPKGGESVYDIINSVGLHEKKLIYKIISEIYKNIKIFKQKEDDDIIKQYQNVPFCLCDIFLTINEEIKIIPPVIRNIPENLMKNNINNNKIKKEKKNICLCRKNYEILKNIFIIHNNSLFCLGLSILQLITQNLLFKLKSYNLLITQKNTNTKNNCCLLHSLLDIEENQILNKNNELLLSNFLSFYDQNISNFIHKCTNFENNFNDINNYPKSDFIDDYKDIYNSINISIQDLYKIISYIKSNDYISQTNFFRTFELLYNEMKINSINFKKLLHENKVINVLIRSFEIDKSEFKGKFRKIINNTENNLEYNELDENKNFVNSGRCFYSSNFRKKLENNGNKNLDYINIENNNKKDNNQGIIIFKNYDNNENV